MPVTKSDISDLVLPGLRAEFALAFRSETLKDPISQFATVINTTQPVQRYPVLDSVPGMREFKDERVLNGLRSQSFAIEDKVFESTLAVDRKAMEDDQLDLIRMRVRELASRVALHRHQLIIELLNGTQNPNGYDGQPILSNNHPSHADLSSNLSSDLLSRDSLRSATEQMMLLTDLEDNPLGIQPDTLVVGPSNYWNALELVESPGKSISEGGAGQVNVFQGRLRVIVSPFIRGLDWYLLDTNRPIRSVILQQRSDVPVEFTALDQSSQSENAFMRDQFLYGVRARYNVGPGMWQTIHGSRP